MAGESFENCDDADGLRNGPNENAGRIKEMVGSKPIC